MWRLSMKWRAAVDRAVKPLGLTHATFSLLGVLTGLSRSGRRPSQRELADHTGLDPIYVSKLARALEKAGLVERPADPDDPRAVRLGLTERGREVITAAIDVVHDLHEELTASIGGSKGSENRRLRDTLQTLLGEIPTGGEEAMTAPRTIDGRDINVAAAATRSILTAVLKREGLTFEQYIVLRTAVLNGPATPAVLVETAAGPANAAGEPDVLRKTLDPLRDKGLADLGELVEATQRGRDLVERVTTEATAAGDRLFEGISGEDLATTKRVLNLVTERASEVRNTL